MVDVAITLDLWLFCKLEMRLFAKEQLLGFDVLETFGLVFGKSLSNPRPASGCLWERFAY